MKETTGVEEQPGRDARSRGRCENLGKNSLGSHGCAEVLRCGAPREYIVSARASRSWCAKRSGAIMRGARYRATRGLPVLQENSALFEAQAVRT